VRGYREALRKLDETRFVFPVGPQLNVWLTDGVSLESFTTRIAEDFAQLKVEPLLPTLHDAAVRDLALAEVGDG
jgi:hypothetical protein